MSNTAATTVAPASQHKQSVEARLLYSAYERKPLNLLMTLVATLLVGGLLWQWIPTITMTVWFIAVLGSAAIGYAECIAFRHAAPTGQAIARWQWVFLAQSSVAGAAWALGPTLMMRHATGAQTALFVAILLTVCTVAMISVSGQRNAMQGFIAATLLPPTFGVWQRGGDIDHLVALVLLCAMVTLSIVGMRFHQSLRRLLESQVRTNAILDTALDAVVGIDAQARITDWNQRAQTLFGWSKEEAIGRELDETIVARQHRQAHQHGLARFLETGAEQVMNRRFEMTAVRRNNEEFPVELAIIPLKVGGRLEFIAFIADITERKRAALAIEESEQRYRTLIDWTPEAIVVHRAGRLLFVNPAAIKLFGASSAQELIGKPMLELIHPDFHQTVLARIRNFANSGNASPMIEEKFLKLDGSVIDVEVQGASIIFDGELAVHAAIRDISERKRAEQDQRIAATAFESQHGMTITNAQRVILRVNKAFSRITGYSAEEAIGRNPAMLASGRHDRAFYAAMTNSLQREGSWQGEIWNRRKSGEVFPEWLNISAVKDDAGLVTHYVAIFSDITSNKSAEDQIRNLAFYDPLTRLPNRRLLLDRLEQTLTASVRHRRYGALLFVDLDNFKKINDTLGHYQGDLLLEQVAGRLLNCIRDSDTVARLGGDEFVVMLDDLSENELEAAGQAKAVGGKILASLNTGYLLGNAEHHNTPSIGVTLYSGNRQESPDEPIKRAELAMYQAKSVGRNTLRFFDPQMQAEVTSRANLEADLREALLHGQFLLHYQAQVVGEGRMTGVEALVRWDHPQRGLVSPADFIALAEDTGLILPLGQWVLETACGQLAKWAKQPAFAHLGMAVNVSARQFQQENFVDNVLAVLAHTGANPKRLKLELTESVLVNDVEGMIAKMSLLKAKGVGFSLDDFGTGYSSLSYLKRLPLDQLKIDQGFVRNILTDPNDAAIAKMVIALAQSLGLTVIAEGVEMQAQRDFLAHQGCHAYQGYFFSRPLALAEFEDFVGRL
jgi:diguanylate cyclase (GGDEF)-like protein/PAS domain S-box-containing protein